MLRYNNLYNVNFSNSFVRTGRFILKLTNREIPNLQNLPISEKQAYQICEEIRNLKRFSSEAYEDITRLIFKNIDSDSVFSVPYTKELIINEHMLSR